MSCDFHLKKSKYSGSWISLESNIISWILMGKWYILEKNLFGVENSTKHNNSNNSLVKDQGSSEIEKIQGKLAVMLRINPTQADQNLYLNLHYDCNNLFVFFFNFSWARISKVSIRLSVCLFNFFGQTTQTYAFTPYTVVTHHWENVLRSKIFWAASITPCPSQKSAIFSDKLHQ